MFPRLILIITMDPDEPDSPTVARTYYKIEKISANMEFPASIFNLENRVSPKFDHNPD